MRGDFSLEFKSELMTVTQRFWMIGFVKKNNRARLSHEGKGRKSNSTWERSLGISWCYGGKQEKLKI